jgi:Trk K+ transport system NAD-binding subunit
MKKSLTILSVLLSLTLTSFSQTDIKNNEDSVVVLPYNIAQQIAEDLIKYDQCTEILNLTNESLELANEKIAKQDSLIQQSTQKSILCRKQVDVQSQQLSIYVTGLEDLQKQNEKLKRNQRWLGAGCGAAILTTILVLFIK